MDGIDNYQHNPSQSSRQLRCLKSKGEQRRRSFCGFGILLVTITLQKNYRETESKTQTDYTMIIVGFFPWNSNRKFTSAKSSAKIS